MCCINTTVMPSSVLTSQNEPDPSLARRSSLDLRAHFARLSVHARRDKQATKESIDFTVQRLAKRTNANYLNAIARRQADEPAELLVRVLSFLRPKFSRSDYAELYSHLLEMDSDELSRFARRYGWRT